MLQPSSLQFQLLSRLSALLMAMLLLVASSSFLLISRVEQQVWQGRELEATQHAATTVQGLLQRVGDTLAIVASLDAQALRTNPQPLAVLLQRNPALLELLRIDAQGQVIASAGPAVLANLFSIPQSNWFRRAADGEHYLGELQIAPDGEPYLIIAQPSGDGGCVTGRLRMDALWTLIGAFRFGTSGGAYVVSATGQVIAHRDAELVRRYVNLRDLAGWQPAPDLAQRTYRNFQGIDVLGSARTIPGTEWQVVAEIPTHEAEAMSRVALSLLVGGLLLFGALLIAAVAHLLYRLIFRSMEQLRVGAEQIGAGDLSYRIQLGRRDEIGRVALAFNQMAAQLQAKNLELALHAQNLEAEIAERRRTEQALNQAKEAAEAANRAKSVFLATMSHELRTPLTAIIGFTELMQLTAAEQNYQHFPEYLATVLRAGRHLLTLINDVLDLSRIEAGRMNVLAEAIAINELLAEVVATVEPLMAANRNVLDADLSADLGTLVSDPTRLRQVLLNVLGNAAKFTEDGTVRLSVERDTSWVRFFVADTGIGISEEQLGQLFTPFSQGDTSLNRKYEGSGLGLALSRRLCRQLGGEVLVQSEPGVGSRFTILLPAQARNAPVSAGTTAADTLQSEADLGDAARSEVVAHDAAVVLVITSDGEVRAGLIRGLRAQRLTVLTAETADAGLRIARDIEPEVIVVAPIGAKLDERTLLALFEDRAGGRASAVIVLDSQVDTETAYARLQAAGAQIVPTEALALDAVLRCLAS